MWRETFILTALAALVTPITTLADPPATSPTSPATQPAAELAPDSPIRAWFNDLANPDAAVRDKAQTQLMGMSREELEGLRLLIRQTRATPSQAAALHDIVIHVFLAGETYEPDPRAPFLGVRWPLDYALPGVDATPRLGVPLEDRIPGFPGFRMLRDGDLVVGVLTRSDVPVQQWTNHPTPIKQMLIEVLSGTTVDKPVVLEVLRQGQRLRIPIKLAPRPAVLSGNPNAAAAEAFLAPRLQRAEAYWQQQFLPLLRQEVS